MRRRHKYRYFAINRARQYGKTTTLAALDSALSERYDVISLDFQDVTDADFENENEFTRGLAQLLCDTRDSMGIPVPDQYYEQFLALAGRSGKVRLNDIFRLFDRWCKENQKPVVLIFVNAWLLPDSERRSKSTVTASVKMFLTLAVKRMS